MGSALLKMRRTHMMRRVLALAMACLMLSGCGPVRTEPWDNEVAQTGRRSPMCPWTTDQTMWSG